MPASAFSEAMTISSISFSPVTGTGTEVTFYEFYVDMGYCASEELSATYNANYVGGVRYRVFERTSPVTFNASDLTIYFDTPFFYVPANGNLILDISWPEGTDQIYTFSSSTTGFTNVQGAYGLPTGEQFMETPHMFINGELALNQMTFAGIKASFQ